MLRKLHRKIPYNFIIQDEPISSQFPVPERDPEFLVSITRVSNRKDTNSISISILCTWSVGASAFVSIYFVLSPVCASFGLLNSARVSVFIKYEIEKKASPVVVCEERKMW